MAKDIQVSASILCADFANLGDEIKKCEEAGVDMIHVDVMDGHFVPPITIGSMIIEAIRPLTKLPIDAHLMVDHPTEQIEDYIKAGADIISIHTECYGVRREGKGYWQFPKEIDRIKVDEAKKDIIRIKDRGKKAFLVINPGTPLCVEPLLNDIDGVLIMSVNPGFAKQKFMPAALPKMEALRAIYDGDIAVDGGVNEHTAPQAVKAGANILATASYFFGSDKPKDVVTYLKGLKIQ